MWCAQRPGAGTSIRSSAPRPQSTGRPPGPAHRFPYLEATNSRINFKDGAEKLPFSLIDTDLSLWQENPGEWRLRLRGQPARTDVALDMADTGIVRLEASVHRAPDLRQMPLQRRCRLARGATGTACPVADRLRSRLARRPHRRAAHTGHAQCGSGHRQVGRHGCTARGVCARHRRSTSTPIAASSITTLCARSMTWCAARPWATVTCGLPAICPAPMPRPI